MNKETFVGKYEPMNPDTEFLVPSSDLLQNGMEILDADFKNRVNMTVTHERGTWQYDRALERNRWCKISHLKYDHSVKIYRFCATYSDGTQRLRYSEISQAWLVKLDSVDVLQQTRDAVMKLVDEAMWQQDAASFEGKGNGAEVTRTCSTATDAILKIFGMGVQK